MSGRQETADAIIDEMRDCARAADPSIWGGAAIQKLVENTKRQQLAYCDRLEAALERERAQVGNKAAWRAALVWVRERMVAGVYDGTVDAHEVLDKVEKALAAPVRGCDLIVDSVDDIKANWDAQFYKWSAQFSPLTRVIVRQSAHAAIDAYFGPITEDCDMGDLCHED
jgi:hypothetical protein